jgi:hypothetical protein
MRRGFAKHSHKPVKTSVKTSPAYLFRRSLLDPPTKKSSSDVPFRMESNAVFDGPPDPQDAEFVGDGSFEQHLEEQVSDKDPDLEHESPLGGSAQVFASAQLLGCLGVALLALPSMVAPLCACALAWECVLASSCTLGRGDIMTACFQGSSNVVLNSPEGKKALDLCRIEASVLIEEWRSKGKVSTVCL